MAGCMAGLAICVCNPWLSGFAFYGRTFRLSLCSCLPAGLSGTVRHSGPGDVPGGTVPVSAGYGRSHIFTSAL